MLAAKFAKTLLLRTVRPNTSPRVSTIRWPATFHVVLTNMLTTVQAARS
jgi:hypothetical protein